MGHLEVSEAKYWVGRFWLVCYVVYGLKRPRNQFVGFLTNFGVGRWVYQKIADFGPFWEKVDFSVFRGSWKMVFLKSVGLNFYSHARLPSSRPHVKNQLNSLLKSHFSRPLKNVIFSFSGTSPGFLVRTRFFSENPGLVPEKPKIAFLRGREKWLFKRLLSWFLTWGRLTGYLACL